MSELFQISFLNASVVGMCTVECSEYITAVIVKAEEREETSGGVKVVTEGLIGAKGKQGIGEKGKKGLFLFPGVQVTRPRHNCR